MNKDELITKIRELPPEDWDLPMGKLAEKLGDRVASADIAAAIDYIKANPQPITMRGGLTLRRMGAGNVL
jgi:hypothetical protein